MGSSSNPIKFDTRVIAASKKDLWAEAQAGRFREDLYFRLSVFTVALPPLRDRKEDLPLLVDACAGSALWEQLPEEHREKLTAHTWPGNVRELRNAIERLKHMTDLPELSHEALLRNPRQSTAVQGDMLAVKFDGSFKDSKDELIRAFEKEYLTRLLAKAKGNIAKAAREAELDRKHLYSLLHKYALVKSTEVPES